MDTGKNPDFGGLGARMRAAVSFKFLPELTG
jgi:hypothetical protein